MKQQMRRAEGVSVQILSPEQMEPKGHVPRPTQPSEVWSSTDAGLGPKASRKEACGLLHRLMPCTFKGPGVSGLGFET